MNSARDVTVTRTRCYSNSRIWPGPSGPWAVTINILDASVKIEWEKRKGAWPKKKRRLKTRKDRKDTNTIVSGMFESMKSCIL